MKQEFAVKSDSFALYEAFKKECEEIGWKYNDLFTPFNNFECDKWKCMWFDKGWDNFDKNMLMFSISTPDSRGKIFNLGSQFSEALAYAKKVFEEHLKEIEESKKKKITYEDVKKSLSTNNTWHTVLTTPNKSQLSRIIALNKLMNVAVYLNPKGEMAEWSISKYSNGILSKAYGCRSFGQPFFISEESIEQAIEILGEDVVMLALS